VVVPLRLLLVCNQIAGRSRGDEFSVVTNILEKKDTSLTLSEEFYIPKQVVAGTSIDYQPDEYLYNCVIHRHPDGCNSFSATDQSFINQNFDLSLLYTKQDGFVHGLYNLRYENDYIIQLPVEILIDYGLAEIDISNIQKPGPVLAIDKSKRSKSRHERRISDSDKPEISPVPPAEESLDYLMELMFDEINGDVQDLRYRMTNVEDTLYHQTGFNSFGR
jgi:hypothetical protein